MALVKHKQIVVLVDELAKRYGKLPHEILQLTPREFFLNVEIMQRARAEKKNALQRLQAPVFPVVEVD